MGRTNTNTGGGGGGMAIGEAITGSSAFEVLYTSLTGTLESDAGFLVIPNGSTFNRLITSLYGASLASLQLVSNAVSSSFVLSSTNGSALFGISTGVDKLVITSNDLLFRFPTVASPASVWTPMLYDGAELLSLAIPLHISTTSLYTSLGSDTFPLNDLFLGRGLTSVSLADSRIRPSAITGTNAIGNAMIIAGGIGTGNAVGSGVKIAVPSVGAPGTTEQSLQTSVEFDGNCNIRAFKVHNNLTAQGSATQQDIRSGTYTPTAVIIANVLTATPQKAQWLRVGNVVTVSGTITLDPITSSLAASVRMSLPVPSNLAISSDCSGVGNQGVRENLLIVANTANDQANFEWVPSDVNSRLWSYIYSYEVL